MKDSADFFFSLEISALKSPFPQTQTVLDKPRKGTGLSGFAENTILVNSMYLGELILD